MLDFLAAVDSEGGPVADIEEGHISTASCIMANIAMQTGRPIRYDSKKRIVIDDKEATNLLHKPYRGPWKQSEQGVVFVVTPLYVPSHVEQFFVVGLSDDALGSKQKKCCPVNLLGDADHVCPTDIGQDAQHCSRNQDGHVSCGNRNEKSSGQHYQQSDTTNQMGKFQAT
jgi:hypothetical protein